MTKQQLSFEEIFKFGWAKTKQHAWFITLTFIISSLVINASTGISPVNILVAFMTVLSVVSISLTMSRDQHFTFGDLYMPLLSQRRVLKFVVLAALYIFPVLVVMFSYQLIQQGVMRASAGLFAAGLILSIPASLAAVYTTVRFKFFPFIVVEHEGATISNLIKMSYSFTEGRFVQVLFFLFLATVLNIAPIIIAAILGNVFLLGIFITAPVTVLATAHLYNRIKDHTM